MENMHKPTAAPSPAPPRRTRPPRVDWPSLAPRVAALRAQGCSTREAARRLDMNIKTLEAHLRRHRIRHAIPMDRPDQVRRTCLNCDTAFVADGRFLRLCPECRAMFS
ncbi:helix-turn-helix transcriptional regulator [Komagataeibacter xylinus]|uniref:Helix-turn-helix transcriptional regulator n=1 Tax=Komagataeibacter xylinus TaxID=28448 RepID=A0A857FP41_KOMXY|nr:helix-turn-helix transcriptional regulator [Komagataeibacter xylinus]